MIDKVKEIDLWYVKQLARFLEKMEQTKDIDGKRALTDELFARQRTWTLDQARRHRVTPSLFEPR